MPCLGGKVLFSRNALLILCNQYTDRKMRCRRVSHCLTKLKVKYLSVCLFAEPIFTQQNHLTSQTFAQMHSSQYRSIIFVICYLLW